MCKKNFQFELRIRRLFLKEAAAIGVCLPIMVLVSRHHIIFVSFGRVGGSWSEIR
jgi:hypothetical protein